MKIFGAVTFVAFCTVIQTVSVDGSLNDQFNKVKEQINVVDEFVNVIREMQYVDVFPRVFELLAAGQTNMTQVVETNFNATTDHLKESGENSTAAGKDPTGCATTARTSLETLRTSTTRTIDACFDSVREWLYKTENAIESGLEDAMKLVSYLNLIFPSCYTTDLGDIESCIDPILKNATQLAEVYKSTSITFLASLGQYLPVQEQMLTCMAVGELTLEQELDTVKSDFTKCVATL